MCGRPRVKSDIFTLVGLSCISHSVWALCLSLACTAMVLVPIFALDVMSEADSDFEVDLSDPYYRWLASPDVGDGS
eukprot:1380256-Lingulodinium_polyedra.AAC.1